MIDIVNLSHVWNTSIRYKSPEREKVIYFIIDLRLFQDSFMDIKGLQLNTLCSPNLENGLI